MFRCVVPLALLLASAAPAQFAPPSDADALAEQVRRLGSNPRDLDALLTAGELSIRLEDWSAAGAFFARAEKIDPRNARAKAGEGAIILHAERPTESLHYFAQAEQLGLPTARFAVERGLAYDLIGDPGRAHRDYQAALASRDDPEARRRYALSLAIAGRQQQALAELDPLIRQNDRAAWRTRAFVLAMGGDAAGATRIAETMMPPGAATALQGFFTQLPRLSAVDKAFAVHFGEVQATPQRLADARLPREAPLPLAPLVSAPVQVAAAAPPAKKRRGRDRREQVAMIVAAPPPPPPLPAPPSYQAPTYVAPAAATPVRDRPLSSGELASLSAAGNRVRPNRSRSQPSTAPVVPATRSLTPDEQRSLAAAAGSRDGTSSHRPDTPRGVALTSRPADAVPPPVAAAARVPAVSVPVTLPSTPAVSVTAASPSPVAAPALPPAATPTPPVVASVAPSVSASAPAIEPPRALTAAERASLLAATADPAAPPTPGFSAASGVPVASAPTPRLLAPAPAPAASYVPPIAPATPSAPLPRPARRSYAQADSVLSRIVAGLSVPATELDVAAATGPTAAERRAAARKAAADKQAAADKKAAAEAKAAADREAAEERRIARSEPARIWVQVAGGANEKALVLGWKTVSAGAPALFASRQAWTTPLRATNRILTGPFKTDAEARAFVNQLSKAGVPAFTFTSEAGQKITRLATK